jgi:hypothetical protein
MQSATAAFAARGGGDDMRMSAAVAAARESMLRRPVSRLFAVLVSGGAVHVGMLVVMVVRPFGARATTFEEKEHRSNATMENR